MRRDWVAAGAAASWLVRGQRLSLARPLIMGIVNVTPDSFSDGGRYATYDRALAHARQLLDEGADVLDIGGESTRPGAADVPVDIELERVVPLVQALAPTGVPISVDTSKPAVMQAALAAGAAIINDVRALADAEAQAVVSGSDCGVVLMHMQGTPRSMQVAPHYDEVVGEVAAFLVQHVTALEAAGIARTRIAIDPGFGFGKTAAHNFTLLRDLARFVPLGCPLLIGVSRKSMLGALTGRPVGERVVASVTAAVLAVQRGARIVRVHDVAATRDALRVWYEVEGETQ